MAGHLHRTADTCRPGAFAAEHPGRCGLDEVLAEIASLANALCEHLADDQWDTASRIRHLARLDSMPADMGGAS